ncbi:MAG: hypothetical protein RLZZ401_2320, partial [Pseudomonadota bacterium]
ASQAYAKALQLDANNQAVQPKLGLIRELFAPGAKGQKPSATPVPAAAPVAPAPLPAPAAVPLPAPSPVAAAKPLPAPASAAGPLPAPAATGGVKDIEAAVQAWAGAWATKDMAAYLGAYGKEFDPPGNQSRPAWEEERRKRIVGKSSISVKVREMAVSMKGAGATVKFKQDYAAGALTASSRKTLELVKVGERWVIVKEYSGS